MPDRKMFTNSVVPLPDHVGLTPTGLMINAAEPARPDQKVEVMFSLETPPDVRAELESKIAAGETVPASDLVSRYGGDPAHAKALADWLTNAGFTIKQTAPDRSAVWAVAPASVVEAVLQVKMVPVTRDGITYLSAANAPSLPSDVGGPVHAILGLQPFRRAQKHFRTRFSRAAANRLGLTRAGKPSPNATNQPPYLIAEILKAYGGAGLPVSGKGQSIAILIDTFPRDDDLAAFWKANGLSIKPSQVKKINVGNTALPPPEGEETLDACWSGGIAPGAEVRVYASGSLQFSALDKALDRIIADLPSHPGLRQLSISLGLGERYMGGADGEVAAQHIRFLKLAAAGVNVFVSSGDAGSNPDETGHSPTGPLQAEYECSDPAVIAVGGTRLDLAADGSVASETGWAGGGGGRSILFNRPAWQIGAGVPGGSDRLVPDVCAAADPNTGAFLIMNGRAMGIGGTSWSAPVWAGICALINEARQKAGMPFLAYLNPALYPLAGSAAFRDISEGSNGAYTAGPGYDLVTGLGAPNIAALIAALAGGDGKAKPAKKRGATTPRKARTAAGRPSKARGSKRR